MKETLNTLYPIKLLLPILMTATLTACTNTRTNALLKQASNLANSKEANTNTGGDDDGSNKPVLIDSFKISSVNISGGGGSGSDGPATTIFFDTTKSVGADGKPVPISNHCNVATNSAQNAKPCVCTFDWQEINPNSGVNTPIKRSVQTLVTSVQPSVIVCSAPGQGVYDNEIIVGTGINVSVTGAPGNASLFTVKSTIYTKQKNSIAGSFKDLLGNTFDNVLHYACYEQFKRGMDIKSKIGTKTNPTDGSTKQVLRANRLCVQKLGGGGGNSEECGHLEPAMQSAQAYYYNLYIRDSERGNINEQNQRFTCPRVKESLISNGLLGSQSDFYPKDSTFALSLAPTPDFNIGVEAFTSLSGGSDPVIVPTTCYSSKDGGAGDSSGSGSSSSLNQSCLGFAAKPNPDGTCPYFRDASGQLRFTFRLRRFIALYPMIFDTDGSQKSGPQSTDTVYVLDRPVGVPATADPLKPYTMRGPKPCPFAFFDWRGVLGHTAADGLPLASYAATNNPLWNAKNVDGIMVPNEDTSMSCSMALPILSPNYSITPDEAIMSMATVNEYNPIFSRIYIRPIRSWSPHYEEDLDFQACAPQASPLRDPPLHFAKDTSTGNVSWCAESYPTQNDSVAALDRKTNNEINAAYTGEVIPFTSHVAKNSASAKCEYTPLESIPKAYPATNVGAAPPGSGCVNSAQSAGVAWHPRDLVIDADSNGDICSHNTCDRTAQSGTAAWKRFPLLARPAQVESAISADSTFGCVVTYDNGAGKTGKKTPTQGCCGVNVKVWTDNKNKTPNDKTTAHLEPDAACLIPQH